MILITGGTGRIGSVLVSEITKNQKIKVLVRQSSNVENLKNENIELVYGDVTNLEEMKKAIEGVDTIFHLAGEINITSNNEKKTFGTNIGGTKQIVDLCLSNNISLVYTSSVHAFNAPKDGSTVTEDTPLSTNYETSQGIYDYSKGEATQYIKDKMKEGLNAIILHPSGVVGPFDLRPSIFGGGMINLVKNGVKTTIDGRYDYVDVRDVVWGILKAYELKKFGSSYILSNEILTMEKYTQILRELSGIKRPTKLLSKNISLAIAYISSFFNPKSEITPYSVKTLWSNCDFSHNKANLELGYKPISVEQSIRDQYNWFKNNGYFNKAIEK